MFTPNDKVVGTGIEFMSALSGSGPLNSLELIQNRLSAIKYTRNFSILILFDIVPGNVSPNCRFLILKYELLTNR